jgi:hypothetical protein
MFRIRPRRGLNWFTIGLLYASYYMCRYNFRFATPGMVRDFGFSTFQITGMLSAWSIAYGTGQLVNGLLTDGIGGKTAMLIGAAGTIAINLIFGFASFAGTFTTQIFRRSSLARRHDTVFFRVRSYFHGRDRHRGRRGAPDTIGHFHRLPVSGARRVNGKFHARHCRRSRSDGYRRQENGRFRFRHCRFISILWQRTRLAVHRLDD